MKFSDRLDKMPPYMFAELDKVKEKMAASGQELLDLGVGDPVEAPPSHIIKTLERALQDTENHRYPPYPGTLGFRKSVAGFYDRRFGVPLDPGTEVLSLVGSKEGIAHIFQAVLSPGDYAILTDPCFPMYRLAAALADGEVYSLPIEEGNGYLPDLESIPMKILKKSKIILLNYPNNPTSAVAPLGFFSEAVAFAKEYGLVICNDNVYSEIAYDGYRPPSILEVPGAKEVAIEFNSLSKPYNMAGWRLGYAVGNSEVIAALAKVKEVVDSGIWKAVQEAGADALDNGDSNIQDMIKIYKTRRDMVVKSLKEAGVVLEPPQATLYVWAKVPDGQKSEEFVKTLLQETGVVVTSGTGFGEYGEGYFRISLTVKDDILKSAMTKLRDFVRSRVTVAI